MEIIRDLLYMYILMLKSTCTLGKSSGFATEMYCSVVLNFA